MWPKQRWPRERLGEHAQGVVRLAEVRRVDLAGVAGEDHLRAVADAGEDRAQRGGLEVLGLVDDDELALQRTAPQERDRLERQLTAGGQLVDQVARVVLLPPVGEGHDRIVDRRHPRVELLVEPAGQEPDIGASDGHQRPVDRQALERFSSTTCSRPAAMARMVLPVPARPSRATTEIVGVEEQLEGEALLLAPWPQAPRFGHRLRQQDELVVDTSHERRLRTAAQDGELVLAERAVVANVSVSTASAAIAPAAYRQSIASYEVSIVVQPTAGRRWSDRVSRCSAARTPRWAALMRSAASLLNHGGRAEARPGRSPRR